MNALEEQQVQCPYCGETIDVMIDCTDLHQNYIEDCQVCCQPITFDISVGPDGELAVYASSEND